ncbi:unnamed protein product, partial [Ixodes pacificus]
PAKYPSDAVIADETHTSPQHNTVPGRHSAGSLPVVREHGTMGHGRGGDRRRPVNPGKGSVVRRLRAHCQHKRADDDSVSIGTPQLTQNFVRATPISLPERREREWGHVGKLLASATVPPSIGRKAY